MEVLILLPARFFAITNAFARAFDRQNISLVAPLALTDKGTSRVLIFISEAGIRPHLDNHDHLVELLVTDRKRRANEGLQRRARELNSGIFLAAVIIYKSTRL